MRLTTDELARRLDEVARHHSAAGQVGRDDIRHRARRRQVRTRTLRLISIAAVAIGATALVVVTREPGATSVTSRESAATGVEGSGGQSTTTSDARPGNETVTLARRPTRAGELTLTRGPYTASWNYGPGHSSDRWRLPSTCYPPLLTLRIGNRVSEFADGGVAVASSPSAGIELLIDSTGESDPVVALIVVGAPDGTRYRADQSTGDPDEATAAGGIAVLLGPAELWPNLVPPPNLRSLVVAVHPDGSTTPVPANLTPVAALGPPAIPSLCPDAATSPPATTVSDLLPSQAADAADAAAVATRALDPDTDRAVARSLFTSTRGLDAQLDALASSLEAAVPADFAGERFRFAPQRNEPARFDSPDSAWISFVDVQADGGQNGGAAWVRVRRSEHGWQVDNDSICAAIQQISTPDQDVCPGW